MNPEAVVAILLESLPSTDPKERLAAAEMVLDICLRDS